MFSHKVNISLCFLTIFTCFATIANMADASRILAITPMPYFSHQYFYRPVWRELANRGHEIVLITAAPMPGNLTNIKQIDISFITKMLPRPGYTTDYIDQIEGYYELMLAMAEAQLSSPKVQQLIHNPKEHFDLVIVEFTCPVMFSFKKRFNTPLILVSPMDMLNYYYERTGSPSHELLYSFFREIQTEPGFLHRLKSFVTWAYEYWHIPSYFPRIDAVSKKFFGSDALAIEDALQQFDLTFTNVNMALQEVRPFSPAVIPMGGGMFLEEAKTQRMPRELQQFLDQSHEGVIYISFGTYIQTKSMSANTVWKLTEIFSSLPYKFLWKSEPLSADMLKSINKTGNVYITKWLPQPKVLGK